MKGIEHGSFILNLKEMFRYWDRLRLLFHKFTYMWLVGAGEKFQSVQHVYLYSILFYFLRGK